jgi:hypothetical protein
MRKAWRKRTKKGNIPGGMLPEKTIGSIDQCPHPLELQLPHADAEDPKSMPQSSLNPVIEKSTLIGFAFSRRSFSTR